MIGQIHLVASDGLDDQPQDVKAEPHGEVQWDVP